MKLLIDNRTGLSREASESEIQKMREGYKRNKLGNFDSIFTVQDIEVKEQKQPVTKKPRTSGRKKEE